MTIFATNKGRLIRNTVFIDIFLNLHFRSFVTEYCYRFNEDEAFKWRVPLLPVQLFKILLLKVRAWPSTTGRVC